MAVWKIDTPIPYSPSSGETNAEAWQKQIEIDQYLINCINRVRVMDASAGSNISDPEAFQFKVNTTDKTLLIRNASNTGWIICGYLDKDYFGITPETIYGVKNNGGVNSIEVVTEQPITGGSNGNIAIDTTNKKLYQRINGVWTLLLSLSASDMLDYTNLIKNNGGDIGKISIVNTAPSGGANGDIAIDITNKRMYQKNNDTWNLIFSLRASDLSDYDDLTTQEDVSTTAEADKIPRADNTGKLPNNIAGSPDKIAGKKIVSDAMTDGTTPVYRSSADDGNGAFVFEKTSASSVIDDTQEGISSTYSSSKIQDLLDELKVYIENSGINILKRNKAYNVGDIAYSTKITSTTHLASKLYLECVEAGTSAVAEPTLANLNINDEITDGTAKFKVYDVGLQSRPVGNIYQSTVATSPAELFGGTWEEMPAGRVLLAQGQSDWGTNYAAGSTGGEAQHTLSYNEMPLHNHNASTSNAGGHNHTTQVTIGSPQGGSSIHGAINGMTIGAYTTFTSSWNGGHSHVVTVSNAGGGQAHNNMQPYITCYIWKRTA